MSKHVAAKKSPKAAAGKAKTSPIGAGSAVTKTLAGSAPPAAAAAAAENSDLSDESFLRKKLNKKALRDLFVRAGCTRTGGPHFYMFVRSLIAKRVQRDVSGLVALANYYGVKTLTVEHVMHYHARNRRIVYGTPEYR